MFRTLTINQGKKMLFDYKINCDYCGDLVSENTIKTIKTKSIDMMFVPVVLILTAKKN